MRFRASSAQPSGQAQESGNEPDSGNTLFRFGTLRSKRSRPALGQESTESGGNAHEPASQLSPSAEENLARPSGSRRQAVQDFLRTTSTSLKRTGTNLRTQTAKLPQRIRTRAGHAKNRVSKSPSSSAGSKRQSRVVAQPFDISDDVLDKLMGPRRDIDGTKIQSANFLVKQRKRAMSARTGATLDTDADEDLPPLPIQSQAEMDRKPLSAEEVEEMFLGAPYFTVEKLGQGERWRPQVVFRGGDVEESRLDGRDYVDLGHESFAACTLQQYRPRGKGQQLLSSNWGTEKMKVEDELLELPSMLSANGVDPGTVGFEYFLELPVADSMIVPEETTISIDKRKLLYASPEKLGLREIDLETLIRRQHELRELWASHNGPQQEWNEQRVAEMGEELFTKVLDGELGTTSAGTGSVTLRTQITALQKVLNQTELWHDFSQVEWRIRVGQLLWSSLDDEEPEPEEDRQPSERDVLLLQITLAAELALRMDVLQSTTAGEYNQLTHLTTDERLAIETAYSKKLRWDALLARTFLQNVAVEREMQQTGSMPDSANHRMSLFSAVSFLTARDTSGNPVGSTIRLAFLPKDAKRQLAGLLQFADELHWPHKDELKSSLESKLIVPLLPEHLAGQSQSSETLDVEITRQRPVSGVSVYATPLSSPLLPAYTPRALPATESARNSYFGLFGSREEQKRRPCVGRKTTADSMQLLAASWAADHKPSFEVGGWLSRSWLAGLVLPGEPASHFLISTLLENSPDAIEVLGDSANLYGGFVYKDRTYWSLSSVVGRVSAAVKGANHCMGWMSASVLTPEGETAPQNGWVTLDIKDVRSPTNGEQPRIKEAGVVAAASDPLHGADIAFLQAGDFTTPTDGPLVFGNEVRYEGITFIHATKAEDAKLEADPASEPPVCTAQLSFTSAVNAKLEKANVPLTYDVYFIASHPCQPALRTLGGKRAANAEKEGSTEKAESPKTTHSSIADKELPPAPAHPLHIEYHVTTVPVATLLNASKASRPRALSAPAEREPVDAQSEEVVILDCRSAPDLEVLARAWCASVGEHALIGKTGRTCLACCVREARGLGVAVVIRI